VRHNKGLLVLKSSRFVRLNQLVDYGSKANYHTKHIVFFFGRDGAWGQAKVMKLKAQLNINLNSLLCSIVFINLTMTTMIRQKEKKLVS